MHTTATCFFLCIDPNQAWLSNNESKIDLIAHRFDMKAKFIINLSSKQSYSEANSSATSRYTHNYIPTPSADELEAIKFLSSEKNEQSDEAYPMHANNMEKYLSRTNID